MFDTAMAYGQIIIADLILSGDNALIIGMAAAGLSPELRKRAILYGMVIAAVLRIVFDRINPAHQQRTRDRRRNTEIPPTHATSTMTQTRAVT